MAANDSTAQFNAVATAVVNDLAVDQRRIDELNAARRELSDNGYVSLLARAQADEPAKYGNAMRSNDSPVMYRSTADPPQDCVSDKLDSVERSIQTLESYLDTLQTAWACTHTELAIECFKEFKQKLHRGEAAVERAYRTPAEPAPTPVSDFVRAAVDEVMAEA